MNNQDAQTAGGHHHQHDLIAQKALHSPDKDLRHLLLPAAVLTLPG